MYFFTYEIFSLKLNTVELAFDFLVKVLKILLS